jgi:hypothetical protein
MFAQVGLNLNCECLAWYVHFSHITRKEWRWIQITNAACVMVVYLCSLSDFNVLVQLVGGAVTRKWRMSQMGRRPAARCDSQCNVHVFGLKQWCKQVSVWKTV